MRVCHTLGSSKCTSVGDTQHLNKYPHMQRSSVPVLRYTGQRVSSQRCQKASTPPHCSASCVIICQELFASSARQTCNHAGSPLQHSQPFMAASARQRHHSILSSRASSALTGRRNLSCHAMPMPFQSDGRASIMLGGLRSPSMAIGTRSLHRCVWNKLDHAS